MFFQKDFFSICLLKNKYEGLKLTCTEILSLIHTFMYSVLMPFTPSYPNAHTLNTKHEN